MLQLKNITKTYVAGDMRQEALKDVSISFRECEFVSILGQSGSGKTTLLNIIGGLDRYTNGDLIINSVSTKKYRDRDWDSYRNHSIGFVFQSYNLIPHQSVLSNVELALTLAGVSKRERRARAKSVLKKVGLEEHMYKKPNQMSGGQMQRVAIARALINNPDILLADEPTGALDSETSIQIMGLLKEIAADKLVIMVTHNPELANEYSTRIIRLLDGRIIDDTDPFEAPESVSELPHRTAKVSMSLFTALSLSFNNLRTKKGRTFLTAFAGSIGIIGIGLILSLSTGIQKYVDDLQRDTLSSYPVSITKEESPITGMLTAGSLMRENENSTEHTDGTVYSDDRMYMMFNAMFASDTQTNNLTGFKKYLDDEMGKKQGENLLSDHVSAISYQYDIKLNTYVEGEDGRYKSTDMASIFAPVSGADENTGSGLTSSAMASQMGAGAMSLWNELLPGTDGELISDMICDQYELAAGRWPESEEEIVLILNRRDEISDVAFYALGMMSDEEVKNIMGSVMNAEMIETDPRTASYEDILGRSFRLILNTDYYSANSTGTWDYIGDDDESMQLVINHGMDLKIVGIIRPDPDASAQMLTGTFGYTSALTEEIIRRTDESQIVIDQKKTENINRDVITGLPFVINSENDLDDSGKAEKIKEYFKSLNDAEKTDIYTKIASEPSAEYLEQTTAAYMQQFPDRKSVIAMVSQSLGMDTETAGEYLKEYSDEELNAMMKKQITEMVKKNFAQQAQAQVTQFRASSTVDGDLFGVSGYAAVAAAFDDMINTQTDEKVLAGYYDSYMPSQISGSTLEENLKKLAAVDRSSPSAINIYAKSFDDKEFIADSIEEYNSTAAEEDVITYTDYVALLMSGVSTMINAVSYGLIAFVSISLIVSSIMIGIITYISVLERTKEIGILRSVGASKKDISRVFNAETAIIGLSAGLIGIGITVLLNQPISLVIEHLTDIPNIACLPFVSGTVLVLISVVLTMLAGLIPSKVAARKDPVAALRTE